MKMVKCNFEKDIEDIDRESMFEWVFTDLTRRYFQAMRENIIFIYPTRPDTTMDSVR